MNVKISWEDFLDLREKIPGKYLRIIDGDTFRGLIELFYISPKEYVFVVPLIGKETKYALMYVNPGAQEIALPTKLFDIMLKEDGNVSLTSPHPEWKNFELVIYLKKYVAAHAAM